MLMCSWSGRNNKGKSSVSKEFANKNDNGKTVKTHSKEAGQQAEGVADHRQPAEEERPYSIFAVNFFCATELPVINAQKGADKKIRTPQANDIGGAGAEEVSNACGNNHMGRRNALEN